MCRSCARACSRRSPTACRPKRSRASIETSSPTRPGAIGVSRDDHVSRCRHAARLPRRGAAARRTGAQRDRIRRGVRRRRASHPHRRLARRPRRSRRRARRLHRHAGAHVPKDFRCTGAVLLPARWPGTAKLWTRRKDRGGTDRVAIVSYRTRTTVPSYVWYDRCQGKRAGASHLLCQRSWPAIARSTDLSYPSYRLTRRTCRRLARVSSPTIPDPVTGYLARNSVADPRVVPLTGDASDRRYFRVLPRQGESFVLAVYAAPFDTRRCRSSTSPTCSRRCRCRCRASSATPTTSACWRSRISATSRCRRISARRRRPSTRRSIAQAVSLHRHAPAPRRASSQTRRTSRTASRSTSRSSRGSWTSSSSTSSRRTAASRSPPASATALRERVRGRSSRELAAEPRVLCHRDYHSRNLMLHDGRLCIIDFQDARMGPDTYDLVVAAARFVRRPAGARRRRADRVLPRAAAAAPREARRVPPALRPDGAAAQPEGARHVRLSDDGARAIPSTSSTCRARCNYARENLRQLPALRPAARRCWPRHRRRSCQLTVMRFGLSHAPVSRRASRARAHLETTRAHGFDLVEVFATRTHIDYHDARARRSAAAAGSTSSASTPAACTRRSATSFAHGVWGRRTRTRRRRRPRARRPSPRRALAIDAARRLGCRVARRCTWACRAARRFRRATTTRAPSGAASSRSPRPRPSAGVALALEVIPNDLSDAGRAARLLDGDSSSARRHLPRLRPRAPRWAARRRPPRCSPGYVITTHVHDNPGTDDDHLVAVRRRDRLGRRR